MKKGLVLLLLLLSLVGKSQSDSMFGKDPLLNLENFDKDRLYWGYFLGFNSYDFKIDRKQACYHVYRLEINAVANFSHLRMYDVIWRQSLFSWIF